MPLAAQDLPDHLCSDFHVPEELLTRKDTTLSHLYDWNAKENPHYPLFVYHDPGTSTKLEYITYSTANAAIDRATRYFAHTVGRDLTASTGTPVIGILANTSASSSCCVVTI